MPQSQIHRPSVATQEAVAQRDATIALLQRRAAADQQDARAAVADAELRGQQALVAKRGEYEAAVARHLAFVDRLLQDKDDLSHQVGCMCRV